MGEPTAHHDQHKRRMIGQRSLSKQLKSRSHRHNETMLRPSRYRLAYSRFINVNGTFGSVTSFILPILFCKPHDVADFTILRIYMTWSTFGVENETAEHHSSHCSSTEGHAGPW